MAYNLKSTLDKILMSNYVTEEFMSAYNEDKSEFKKNLLNVLPEVEDCKNQQQRTPWHNRDVLSHILSAVENMNEQTKHMAQTEKRLLSYVMFFHDLGKPKSHINKVVDGEERDGFPEHNKISCYIAKRALPKFGFNNLELQIADFLIDNHDFLIGYMRNKDLIKNENLIEDFIQKIDAVIGNGEKLMQYLLYVAEADNKAQNPKLTKPYLNELAKMQSTLNLISKKREELKMDDKQYYNYKTTIYRFMKDENIKHQCCVLFALEKYPELDGVLKNLKNSEEFNIKGSQFQQFIEDCKLIEKEFNTRFKAFFGACISDANLMFDLHNQFGKNKNLFNSIMTASAEEFAKFIEESKQYKSNVNREKFQSLFARDIDIEKCIQEANERSYS